MALHIESYTLPIEKYDPSKPTLFLVHGGALSHKMYKDTVPYLTARGYTVLAPDLPGHGESVAAGPFTFARSTELLYKALKDRNPNNDENIVLVGISLGGQAVLDLIANHPECAASALVSGASIHPPDDKASWEMPHMPTSQEWIQLMIDDVNTMGMENAQKIQGESFAFSFDPSDSIPPTLIVVGESDVAMAKRDFEELSQITKAKNVRSQSMTLDGAWHNHSIDVPERFATIVDEWAQSSLS